MGEPVRRGDLAEVGINVLVMADELVERRVLRDLVGELAGLTVSAAMSEEDALAQLGDAARAMVLVTVADGSEGADSPLAQLLAAARPDDAGRPAHRVVVWAWHVPDRLVLQDVAAEVRVKWILRPSPAEDLVDAVRAAAAEIVGGAA